MNNKKIIIELEEDGSCTVNGLNFVGPECHNFITEITDAIGITKSSDKKKEFNIRNKIQPRNKVGT